MKFIKSVFRPLNRFIISNTVGKLKYQRFYNLLHEVSLKGMNYGSGYFKTSGELFFLCEKFNKLKVDLNPIIFDVGSNTGEYAMAVSEILEMHQPILYCFEPSKETFKILKQTTAETPTIRALNFGFSDSISEKQLYFDKDHSVVSSLYNRELTQHGFDLSHSETIELQTIDNFCASQNIEHITFLKIDVEGHELNTLKGAINLINSGMIDLIQFEFGEANIDAGNFLKDFYTILSKYDLFRIVKDGLVPLGVYDEKNEIFKTINILAVKNN